MMSCLDEMERRRQRKGTGDDVDAEQREREIERWMERHYCSSLDVLFTSAVVFV